MAHRALPGKPRSWPIVPGLNELFNSESLEEGERNKTWHSELPACPIKVLNNAFPTPADIREVNLYQYLCKTVNQRVNIPEGSTASCLTEERATI